ncbi:MAG: response regulator [Gemmatimonadetes bacterium]|nr:MAG: response regulator [Gemmatimonadota bacterium]
MKVLVVDDDTVIRKMLKVPLEARSYDVTLCKDGREALEAVKNNDFGIIISDIMMPDMNGYELCKQIRALPHGDMPVIIMMTANNAPNVLHEVTAVGADDFIAKPIRVKLLNVRLNVAEHMYNYRLGKPFE